jgi:hypothetical protein
MNACDRTQFELLDRIAQHIIESGLSYGAAKHKALADLPKQARQVLPTNADIEQAVRAYLRLYYADTQPARQAHLRRVALRWMQRLQAADCAPHFYPHLTGAVLNNTATEHSAIHLQTFCDDPKAVHFYLLNAGYDPDVEASQGFGEVRRAVEVLVMQDRGETIYISTYFDHELRQQGAGKTQSKADYDWVDTFPERASLVQLMNAPPFQSLLV